MRLPPARFFYLALLMVISASAPAVVFIDNFDDNSPAVISETGAMADSLDLHWWLNSGAYIYRTGAF